MQLWKHAVGHSVQPHSCSVTAVISHSDSLVIPALQFPDIKPHCSCSRISLTAHSRRSCTLSAGGHSTPLPVKEIRLPLLPRKQPSPVLRQNMTPLPETCHRNTHSCSFTLHLILKYRHALLAQPTAHSDSSGIFFVQTPGQCGCKKSSHSKLSESGYQECHLPYCLKWEEKDKKDGVTKSRSVLKSKQRDF